MVLVYMKYLSVEFIFQTPLLLMCLYLCVYNRVEHDYFKYHPMPEVRRPHPRYRNKHLGTHTHKTNRYFNVNTFFFLFFFFRSATG